MSDPFEPVHASLRRLPVFFVGGLPRSGTTWMQQLLNAHPELLCLGESRFADDLIPLLYQAMKQYGQKQMDPDRFWAPSVRPPMPEHTGPIFRSAFAALAGANIGDKNPDRLVAIGEKTPENIGALKMLWKAFPGSRFIHIVRDPRDGAVSGFVRFQRKIPKDFSREKYIAEYSRNWITRIRAVREDSGGSADYLEVRYEDLHANTGTVAAELFGFLGASTASELVAEAVKAASFETLSGGRQQGEEDPASHYRLGRAGGWREVLSTAEAEIAAREAGPLLAELDYI
ncbi:sulfotransferase [Nisaea acidiphila]|uniref:Sulfotransferase n=1 Tax=Nisaea acidiphila TaxID=1862145 RepID=A0A9J7AWG0_9PROT|nr:sulfotransferase [Nisaea acidiphila]UUX51454.1 sulfotransferase [Nisaea acidiphila]